MQSSKNKYRAIGLMSGTSLDGLDLIAATFEKKEDKWQFQIEAVECFEYNETWLSTLKNLHRANIETYTLTDAEYGKYLGQQVNKFIEKHQLKGSFDVIGSHGHTILHRPDLGYTLQVGSGAQIAAQTKITTVSDLRSADVAAGGQGAPIVPIGEKLLFPETKAFLNIGGISNISFHTSEKVIAYDVCPGNTPLNLLVQQLGLQYDENGNLARSGNLDKELFEQLNNFSFYQLPIPRSLHTDVIVKDFMSIVEESKSPIKDKLYTICEHLAIQIGESVKNAPKLASNKLMISGGGAKNGFLIERIQHHSSLEVVLLNDTLIDYKEALVMAFFAILRLRGESNCIASVTGASKDVCGGNINL